jgi:hypothetical protein
MDRVYSYVSPCLWRLFQAFGFLLSICMQICAVAAKFILLVSG